MRLVRVSAAAAVMLVVGFTAGCGSDESDPTEVDGASATDSDDSDDSADGSDDSGDDSEGEDDGSSGAAGGTLTLGDESITLSSARCYLEEQDAAAGGGKILFVGQGTGTNAAGEDVMIDVSRYDEDSDFAGDSLSVAVGDVMSGEAKSYSTIADTGTVALEGSTMSAAGVPLMSDDDGSTLEVSFEIAC